MSLKLDQNLKHGGQGFTIAAGLVVALLLGLLAWAGAAYARGAAPAAALAPAASPTPTARVHTTVAAAPTSTIAPIVFPIAQTANGLTLQLIGVSRAGESLTADVCYPLPTPSQAWQLGDRPSYVTLQSGASTIGMAGMALLTWQTAPSGEQIGRCDHVYFIVPATLDLTRFSITVARLMTSPSEGPDCDAVQARLTAAGTGIVIACHPDAFTFGWEVITRPLTLTAGAANQIALAAFSDIVTGPWVFAAGLPPVPPTLPDPAASATAADPRAAGAHPDTVSFTRRDDQTGAASYVLLPLDCLARPGGCARPPAPSIPLPRTDVLAAAAWSPAGEAFAFLAGVDGRFDVYRINADGSGLTDLTPSAGVRNRIAWSPAGDTILWEQVGTSTDEIWLMRADGSEPRKLADGGGAAWAPDGKHIVYSVQTDDPGNPAGARSDLYLLDITTPSAPPLRLSNTPALKSDLSFAPGGRYLAFTAQVQAHWGLYVLSLDDAALPLSSLDAPGVTRITPASMDANDAVWSPAGNVLAYSGTASDVSLPAIYVATLDGKTNVQVSAVNRYPDTAPAWSLDGSRMVYVSEDGGHFNICLVNLDGTNLIQLTAGQPGADTTLEFEEPSWRP